METTQQTIIEGIRKQYEEKQITKLDELKSLDKHVKRPAQIFAYVYGSIGSLVLGTGMCFAMKVIGSSMALGIGIGLVGIALTISTYPIFKKVLKHRRNKYSKQILAMSQDLLNE